MAFHTDEVIPFDDLPISSLSTVLFPPPLEVEGDDTPDQIDISLASLPPVYEVSVIGGTFDHLHSGHKILISLAAWITKRKVIVGVTGERFLTLYPSHETHLGRTCVSFKIPPFS